MYNDKIPILVDADATDTALSSTSSVASPSTSSTIAGETPRTSVLMELADSVGVLHDVLKYFWKFDINASRIESRPAKPDDMGRRSFDFFVDFDGSVGEANVDSLLAVLREKSEKLLILDEKEVSDDNRRCRMLLHVCCCIYLH